jgi:hypothetical protein
MKDIKQRAAAAAGRAERECVNGRTEKTGGADYAEG